MANQYRINLSYESPKQDLQEHLGLNTDGTINVKYTLLSWRNMLLSNINILNSLIENSDSIESIIPLSTNEILIECTVTDVATDLLNKQSLVSADIQPEQYIFDDDETNQHRLNLINNLTNYNESDGIFSTSNDSDSESEGDELIDDKKNRDNLISKYSKLVDDEYSSGSE